MQVQFIFNEDDVKALAPISKNVAGEYLSAAMYEAQEIGLKGIIGGALLKALKDYETASVTPPLPYEDLKEKCLPYLVYKTVVCLIPKVQYKIANLGAFTTADEKTSTVDKAGTDALIADYQANADFFCYELQRWLCANRNQFGELAGCVCDEIEANLRSAASCGIWLGGPRGFNLPGEGCC